MVTKLLTQKGVTGMQGKVAFYLKEGHLETAGIKRLPQVLSQVMGRPAAYQKKQAVSAIK